jgi:hypothetical protein
MPLSRFEDGGPQANDPICLAVPALPPPAINRARCDSGLRRASASSGRPRCTVIARGIVGLRPERRRRHILWA